MENPHILVLPFPVQGHIMPLMELSQTLATHGCNITFVNIETNHRLIAAAVSDDDVGLNPRIRLAFVPGKEESFMKIGEVITRSKLEDLIRQIENGDDDDDHHHHGPITGFVVDDAMGWALALGLEMGIKTAVFTPYPALTLFIISNIQKLIDDGIIDEEGNPLKETVEFSPTLPAFNVKDFIWRRFETAAVQKSIFNLFKDGMETAKLAQWTIINTSRSIEPAALSLVPQARAIGPLISTNRLGSLMHAELDASLKWLDQQPPNSVIYASFGSTTIFSHDQFHHLAIGLELTNMPFLWVIRPGSVNGSELDYPEGFLDRVGSRGKVVRWAPQEKVLGHPSVACFFTHCGWNSTIEAVSNGVPLVCWPYFGEQFMNQSYICNVWRVGLGFERKDEEIVSKEEIKEKIETLVSDKSFKDRALELKESTLASVKENGSSNKNLLDFIEWVRN
ncbi:UDP-glycosyltransferase 83A1-like [Impatiens glandulifera]|uniref:UDP-glycosyltransferase 83A1-like n=1 Tax=Impatiens glandulifera TaxID=253017 RepID=UPI001FB15B76|nr:UDP-glycosyltransferase 83A1-like [Impatiens glandulifera]